VDLHYPAEVVKAVAFSEVIYLTGPCTNFAGQVVNFRYHVKIFHVVSFYIIHISVKVSQWCRHLKSSLGHHVDTSDETTL